MVRMFIAVTTNNVQLIVNRFGQVGTISLLWQAGSSQLVGVENGSIIPATGRIEMQPTALMATIILTVRLKSSPKLYALLLMYVGCGKNSPWSARSVQCSAISCIPNIRVCSWSETRSCCINHRTLWSGPVGQHDQLLRD